MIHFSKLTLIMTLVLMLPITTACGSTSTANATDTHTELFISAASSMTDSILSLKELYEVGHPDTSITINFGSSGSLQRQIEQGSPVDLFISASQGKMDILEEQNLLLDGSRVNLLENKLILIIPAGQSSISSFEDLSSPSMKHFAIGQPDSVPAGKYAREALSTMGLYNQITDQLIFAKNVREVLTWVETGNADGGLVYETDGLLSDKVTTVAYADPSTYTPIIYPVAIIKTSKQEALANDFITFLQSDEAREIFESYGFNMAN